MNDTPKNMVVRHDPPRLKARCEHYKIDLPPFVPVYDRIFVYPLDKKDQAETTAGGLHIAEETKSKLGSARGVLVGAGPKAIEQLYAHGIALGDIVVVARLSVWERFYMRNGRPHAVLVVRASEVVGSEDLLTDYDKGDKWLEMSPDGTVNLCDRDGGERPRTDPKDSYEGI